MKIRNLTKALCALAAAQNAGSEGAEFRLNVPSSIKQVRKAIIALSFTLAVSSIPLFAQPYNLDENGNGIQFIALSPYPMPFSVAPDPTGGITTSPVLIYSLGTLVVPGDVALMGSDGSTVMDLLRFFTPAGGNTSDVIFYSRTDDPVHTLADVGIPFSANPVEISEVNPTTTWFPSAVQPGGPTVGALPVFEFFRYTITTDVPEPASNMLLLVAMGIGCWFGILAGRTSSLKGDRAFASRHNGTPDSML